MTSENPPSSIFYRPDFWAYVHNKVAKITYHDGTILTGKVIYKEGEFPKITQATITKLGVNGSWLGTAIIDQSQVKKVEVKE